MRPDVNQLGKKDSGAYDGEGEASYEDMTFGEQCVEVKEY